MIQKLLSTLILLFVGCNYVFCFSTDDLAKMEYARYGEAFENQSLSERLNRLETDIFGMSQTGSLNERLSMLSKMSDNTLNNRIISPYENYYPGEKPSKIKSFWNNITEPFSTSASMTGFTPSWNSSGYDYSGNMYRNEFLNFMNNPNQFCPYHNRYHNTNRFFNRFNNNNNGFLNSNSHSPRYHNRLHNHNHLYNPNLYRNNYYNRYPYIPPNIATRSSVHIIKD